MPEIAIATEKLTRRFGELLAVDSVDLQVESGQFFRISRAERRWQIHHHQNAYRSACAYLRPHVAAWDRFCAARRSK